MFSMLLRFMFGYHDYMLYERGEKGKGKIQQEEVKYLTTILCMITVFRLYKREKSWKHQTKIRMRNPDNLGSKGALLLSSDTRSKFIPMPYNRSY